MVNFKKYALFIVIICNLVVLASCGQKTQDSAVDATQQENSQPGSFDRRGSGEWNQSSPDVYGEVKEISGNKVTLALLEIPQRKQMTEEEMEKMREKMDDINKQGSDGKKRDLNGNNKNGNGNRNGGSRMGGIGLKKYSGEMSTIEIPNGVSITTFERGDNNFEEKKLKIQDIKTGTVMQMWYKKDSGDKKEIEKIRIMSMQDGGLRGKPSDMPGDSSKSKQN